MLAVDFGAGVDWSNTINLGAAIIGGLIALVTLGGVWYAVRRKGRIEGLEQDVVRAERAANTWKTERDAELAKADRLTAELTELKIKYAQAETAHVQAMAAQTAEQTELRHDLKAQVDLLTLKTDQTPVFEGLKKILERMNSAESSGVATVAQLLEGMEERAAKRDAAIIETQERLAVGFDKSNALLERLTEKIADRVGEVVQEKVDQLNPDVPSPDRKP